MFTEILPGRAIGGKRFSEASMKSLIWQPRPCDTQLVREGKRKGGEGQLKGSRRELSSTSVLFFPRKFLYSQL